MKIVVSYRGTLHAPGRETGACLARALRRLGHSVFVYGNYYGSPRRISSDHIPFAPDLLIYCECNDDEPQYKELKSLKAKHMAYWDFDIHTHPARTLMFIMRMGFDFVFFANKLYESSFKKLCPKSYFLPYAIDDESCRELPGIEKTVDVGLCGSPYPTRVALIETLQKAGIDARLFTGVYGEDMVRLVNSFKIHLNYNPGWGRGILNGRVWETIGCGTLLLTQREDFIELFFRDKEHISLYQDVDDCIRLARHWIENSDERECVALSGHKHGLQYHTYVARAQSILETVHHSPGPASFNPLAAGGEIARSLFRGGIKN